MVVTSHHAPMTKLLEESLAKALASENGRLLPSEASIYRFCATVVCWSRNNIVHYSSISIMQHVAGQRVTLDSKQINDASLSDTPRKPYKESHTNVTRKILLIRRAIHICV